MRHDFLATKDPAVVSARQAPIYATAHAERIAVMARYQQGFPRRQITLHFCMAQLTNQIPLLLRLHDFGRRRHVAGGGDLPKVRASASPDSNHATDVPSSLNIIVVKWKRNFGITI
jgi:hypothetical protein